MSAPWYDGVTVTVELSTDPPLTASPTWTDITTDVLDISTRTGRSSESDSFQAGSATLTLANATRKFDPLYSAGPFFGSLRPMNQIRVRAVYSATTYDLFRGYVIDWPQAYDIGNHWATTTVSLADAFAFLANAFTPESVYALEVAADSPTAWYRLGETSGTTAVDSSGNAKDGRYEGGATFDTRTGLIAASSDAAIGFDGVDDTVDLPAVIPSFPVSVEFWMQSTSASTTQMIFSQSQGVPGYWYFRIYLLATDGKLYAEWNDHTGLGGNGSAKSSTAPMGDNLVHHVVVTAANVFNAPTIWIDGIDRTSGASSGGATPDTPPQVRAAIGRNQGITSPAVVPFVGILDELAIYPTVLSAARVAAHYSAGTAPWGNLDSGAVVGKVLDAVSWPAGQRAISAGVSLIQPTALAAASALAHLQTLEATEQGQCYIDGAGKVVFRSRWYRLTTATSTISQGTFLDGAGASYADLSFRYSADFVTNYVQAARDGGVNVTASDATSITNYGRRARSITGLRSTTDGEVRDLANWVVGHYKDPQLRVPALVVTPRSNPATLFPQVLGRSIGDRITVQRTPQAVGSAISQDVLIEGVQHTITPDGSWSTQWLLSPADTQLYFVLDDPVLGRLDVSALAF